MEARKIITPTTLVMRH